MNSLKTGNTVHLNLISEIFLKKSLILYTISQSIH